MGEWYGWQAELQGWQEQWNTAVIPTILTDGMAAALCHDDYPSIHAGQ
jgi:hypothetical protein